MVAVCFQQTLVACLIIAVTVADKCTWIGSSVPVISTDYNPKPLISDPATAAATKQLFTKLEIPSADAANAFQSIIHEASSVIAKNDPQHHSGHVGGEARHKIFAAIASYFACGSAALRPSHHFPTAIMSSGLSLPALPHADSHDVIPCLERVAKASYDANSRTRVIAHITRLLGLTDALASPLHSHSHSHDDAFFKTGSIKLMTEGLSISHISIDSSRSHDRHDDAATGLPALLDEFLATVRSVVMRQYHQNPNSIPIQTLVWWLYQRHLPSEEHSYCAHDPTACVTLFANPCAHRDELCEEFHQRFNGGLARATIGQELCFILELYPNHAAPATPAVGNVHRPNGRTLNCKGLLIGLLAALVSDIGRMERRD